MLTNVPVTAAAAHPTPRAIAPARAILYAAAVGGCIAVLGLRLALGRDLPLWADETWTAMIAGQPDWSAFWREAWLDCNAPLYYVLISLWTELAGASNAALRAPSLLFVCLAGLTPVAWRPSGLSREAALAWGAMVFLWMGSTGIALDARGYGLLLLLGMLQAIAFARLVEAPSLRTAWLWAGIGSAALATHYFSFAATAVQGAMLLALQRRSALRLAPAALAFLPSLAWAAAHLPRLADYARPGIAWYAPLDGATALWLAAYAIGAWTWWFAAAAVALPLAMRALAGAGEAEAGRYRALAAVSLAGLAALALLLAAGAVRPSLTARYLVPLVPSLLLGLILLAARAGRANAAYAALVLLFLAPYADPGPLREELAIRSAFSIEPASAHLARTRPQRVAFVWDHPATPILDRRSLAQFAGVFFARSGLEPEIGVASAPPAPEAGTALLWLYDEAIRPVGSPGSRPGCRHYPRGQGRGIIACPQLAH